MDVIRQSHLETNNKTGRRVMPLKEQKIFFIGFTPAFLLRWFIISKMTKAGVYI